MFHLKNMPKYRFGIHVTSNNFSLLVNMCFHIYVIKIHFCCKFYYSNHTRFDFNVSVCIPFSCCLKLKITHKSKKCSTIKVRKKINIIWKLKMNFWKWAKYNFCISLTGNFYVYYICNLDTPTTHYFLIFNLFGIHFPFT